MNTKPLYVLIVDCGDGSYHPRYTFDTELLKKLEVAYDENRMDFDNGIGCDGDGFHYSTLMVPVECTAESLGISATVLDDDYADRFDSPRNYTTLADVKRMGGPDQT